MVLADGSLHHFLRYLSAVSARRVIGGLTCGEMLQQGGDQARPAVDRLIRGWKEPQENQKDRHLSAALPFGGFKTSLMIQ
jgi:hypothetical protein